MSIATEIQRLQVAKTINALKRIGIDVPVNAKMDDLPALVDPITMGDVLKKYKSIYDGFIFTCDDYYPIKPFDLSDIMTTYYLSSNITGNEKAPKTYWAHDKWKTRQLLDKEGLPHVNYTTHYPYYMEFSKLEEIVERYDLLNESYVFDDIYFNYFEHEEPEQVDKIRLGIWNNNIYKNKFQFALNNPNIKFMCNSVEGWSKELENSLEIIVKNT